MSKLLPQIDDLSVLPKLAIFIGVAVLTHLFVIILRRLASHALAASSGRRGQKLRSIGTLTTSAVVFSLYFFAVSLVLKEFGVSLTAYLASASVLGLAIGFGS